MTRFGQYLRRLREAKGLSVRKAAKKARISDSYLGLLERGKRKNVPGGRILAALATVYGVDPEEMLMEAGAFFEDNETAEDVRIDQVFQEVIADPDFTYARSLPDELSTEAKLFIIELYEKLKGKGC